jgi:hypothetical protein
MGREAFASEADNGGGSVRAELNEHKTSQVILVACFSSSDVALLLSMVKILGRVGFNDGRVDRRETKT